MNLRAKTKKLKSVFLLATLSQMFITFFLLTQHVHKFD